MLRSANPAAECYSGIAWLSKNIESFALITLRYPCRNPNCIINVAEREEKKKYKLSARYVTTYVTRLGLGNCLHSNHTRFIGA